LLEFVKGRGRLVAPGLAALGIVVPFVIAAAYDDLTPRLALMLSSFAVACLAGAFIVFDRSGRDVRTRLAAWEPAVQQMRGATLRLEQMQRRLEEIDANTHEIRSLKHLVNEERHNLSLVAAGMVEIRGIIDNEQANLGTVANALHEIRSDTGRLSEQAGRVFDEVRGFNEIVQALRSHLDALSTLFAALDERTLAEQRNLGLVASGLDGVRRSAVGVERFESRQAAFEDVLVSLSDQIDALKAASMQRGEVA
jgi:chromosome segregation ATPase